MTEDALEGGVMIFKVPTNPNHSMILRYEAERHGQL